MFDSRLCRYNYSLNPEGAYDAIKWMYTFGPDPKNMSHIRDEYVHVSIEHVAYQG